MKPKFKHQLIEGGIKQQDRKARYREYKGEVKALVGEQFRIAYNAEHNAKQLLPSLASLMVHAGGKKFYNTEKFIQSRYILRFQSSIK